MEMGHTDRQTDRRTLRLYDRIGPVGRFDEKSADPFTTSRAYDWKGDIQAVFDRTLDTFFLRTDWSVVT